jgi:hypothetical protein
MRAALRSRRDTVLIARELSATCDLGHERRDLRVGALALAAIVRSAASAISLFVQSGIRSRSNTAMRQRRDSAIALGGADPKRLVRLGLGAACRHVDDLVGMVVPPVR